MRERTLELSRRNILLGIGAVGVAGAGVGIGADAFLSDEEEFTNNTLVAGTLNLRVSAMVVEASTYFTENRAGQTLVGKGTTVDGDAAIGLRVADVKPGDWVIVCFEVTVEGNPGYVQLSAEEFTQYENGQTEPEANVDKTDSGSLAPPLDGAGRGELSNTLRAVIYSDYDGSVSSNDPRDYLSDKDEALDGTTEVTFDRLASGFVLGGRDSPVTGGPDSNPLTRYLLLELPADTGNEVQSDAVEFDLVFETEQVRHNPTPFDEVTQSAALLPATPRSGAHFGADTALDGETLAVSADGLDASGTNSGRVFVFENSDTWTLTESLAPENAASGQLFGEALAMDGNTLIVGATGDDGNGSNAGAAYVFDNSSGSWSQTARLVASDTGAGDSFGQDVAVSGDRVVVGADGASTGGPEAGAAYVFERTSRGWAQTAKLVANDSDASDYFGSRVSTTDDTIAVGAYGDDENGSDAGAAYVFDNSGESWSQTAKLEPSTLSDGDFFGSSVAADGERVLVGAFGTDDSGAFAGAAYAFDSNDGYRSATRITPPSPSTGEFFGWAVDLNNKTAVIGAYGTDSETGTAYLFDKRSGGWTQRSRLLPADPTTGDRFGVAVEIDGDTTVVTADGASSAGPNTGIAYVFTGGGSDV